MTYALTRVLNRTRRKRSPEYLPPYFWHRFGVWRWGVVYVGYFALLTGLDFVWLERGWGWDLLLAITVSQGLYHVPHRIRRRWAGRQSEVLQKKLEAHWRSALFDAYQIGEDVAKFTHFARDVNRYVNENWSSLSVRLTPWEGSGTKFTVYERRRPKREYTFYHD